MPRAPERGTSRSKRRQQQTGNGGFEAFFEAIAGQESGGNYNAINGRTGASGKYQIMPANIGPWSQQVLGRRVSVSEFRNSPQIQDAVARGIMKGYYDNYGARGAASAWYSGSPKKQNQYKRFRPNEPSIGEYVDQVIARIKPGGGAGSANAAEQTARVRPRSGSSNAAEQGLSGGATAPAQAPVVPGYQPASFGLPQAGMSFVSSPKQAGFGSTGDPFAGRKGDPFPAFPGPSQTQAASAIPGAAVDGQAPASQAAVTNATQMAAAGGPRVGETGSEFRDRVISSAMQMIGTPYVWGGTSAKGVDCSGFIQRILGQMGYKVPRVSSDQARFGKKVSLDQIRPGDLVASDNSSRNNGADHIAFYAGDGYIVEAARAGTNVRRRKLGKSDYEDYYGVQLNLPGD